MTSGVDIRLAQPADAKAIAGMLAQLSGELGHAEAPATTPEVIAAHGFGPALAFSCFVAERGSNLLGLAVFFRHFSTARGQPGVYVQDLWVAPQMRGQRLGEQLLGAVARWAAQEWQAGYLSLTVYCDNPRAAHFYRRLGFALHENHAPMSAEGAVFQHLAHRQGAIA